MKRKFPSDSEDGLDSDDLYSYSAVNCKYLVLSDGECERDTSTQTVNLNTKDSSAVAVPTLEKKQIN